MSQIIKNCLYINNPSDSKMQNQRVRCIFNVENSRYQTDTQKKMQQE